MPVFASPAAAIWNVFVQTSGDINTLNDSELLYSESTYFLFAVFLIAMPILFNNFLVSWLYNAYISVSCIPQRVVSYLFTYNSILNTRN